MSVVSLNFILITCHQVSLFYLWSTLSTLVWHLLDDLHNIAQNFGKDSEVCSTNVTNVPSVHTRQLCSDCCVLAQIRDHPVTQTLRSTTIPMVFKTSTRLTRPGCRWPAVPATGHVTWSRDPCDTGSQPRVPITRLSPHWLRPGRHPMSWHCHDSLWPTMTNNHQCLIAIPMYASETYFKYAFLKN